MGKIINMIRFADDIAIVAETELDLELIMKIMEKLWEMGITVRSIRGRPK